MVARSSRGNAIVVFTHALFAVCSAAVVVLLSAVASDENAMYFCVEVEQMGVDRPTRSYEFITMNSGR